MRTPEQNRPASTPAPGAGGKGLPPSTTPFPPSITAESRRTRAADATRQREAHVARAAAMDEALGLPALRRSRARARLEAATIITAAAILIAAALNLMGVTL